MTLSFQVTDEDRINVTITGKLTVDSANIPSEVDYIIASESFYYNIRKDCIIEILGIQALDDMLEIFVIEGMEMFKDATRVIEFLKPVQSIRLGSVVLNRPVQITHDLRFRGIIGSHYIKHVDGTSFIVLLIDDSDVLLEVVAESDDAPRAEVVTSTIQRYFTIDSDEIEIESESRIEDSESLLVQSMFAVEGKVSIDAPLTFKLSEDSLTMKIGTLELKAEPNNS